MDFSDIYGNKSPVQNFPVIKIFEASSIHVFTKTGTAFFRAVGAGAGGGLEVGGAGGWGQKVVKVSAGDEMMITIGAGGDPGDGTKYPVLSPKPGGDTIVRLRGVDYLAAGGKAILADDKKSAGPWDFSTDGRPPGFGIVDFGGVDRLSASFNGWGFFVTEGNNVFIPGSNGTPAGVGGYFASGGSPGRTDYSLTYPGGRGGSGGGGGGPAQMRPSSGQISSWYVGGFGGNGIFILYFFPEVKAN